MNANLIFWPVLAQILLTIAMYALLGARKRRAIEAGGVDRQQTALDNRAWPADVVKVSNNIANQFEGPVLFYVLAFVLYAIDAVDVIALTLAWIYVASRYVHAYIHVGSNYVPARFSAFLFGMLMLMGLLMVAAVRLAL